MILDTNIIIYACQTGGDWLAPWTSHPEVVIASVTRIEALGYPGISAGERDGILGFLRGCPTHALDDGVIETAIRLRQQKRMKLGDSIIAATALEYEIPLITRNTDDFKHIEGLELRNPFAPVP